jgi:hypothetical protein
MGEPLTFRARLTPDRLLKLLSLCFFLSACWLPAFHAQPVIDDRYFGWYCLLLGWFNVVELLAPESRFEGAVGIIAWAANLGLILYWLMPPCLARTKILAVSLVMALTALLYDSVPSAAGNLLSNAADRLTPAAGLWLWLSTFAFAVGSSKFLELRQLQKARPAPAPETRI